MRQITITFTEVSERQETETFADFGDPATGTAMENRRVARLIPFLIALLNKGSLGIAVDQTGKAIEDLRREARVQVDIRKAGE